MLKNIAVVCGGFSGEAQISALSVEMILNNIDKKKYNPYKITISLTEWTADVKGKNIGVDLL